MAQQRTGGDRVSLIVEIIDVTPDEDEPLEAGRLERAKAKAAAGGLAGTRKRNLSADEYGYTNRPLMWPIRSSWVRPPTTVWDATHHRGSRAEEVESEE